jgi:hypothetical protein
MSKGWESKSVEQQQAEAAAPSIAASTTESTAEVRRADADRKRRIQALEMQRERVLSERTASPHRRSALELALATIERDLELLGWSLKL